MNEPDSADDARSSRYDLPIAVLLGIVAVLTAVATYLAVLEDGDTIASFNEGIRTTDLASQLTTEGNQQFTQDQALFLEYAKAANAGDEEIAGYLRETLFTPELEEAVAWWQEQEDAVSPFEEGSPYALPTYAEAEALDATAQASFTQATQHDEDGDKYVLATVVLSIALFLLGVAGVRRSSRIQLAMVIFASAITVLAVVQIVAVAA